jgi:hypothetical protein
MINRLTESINRDTLRHMEKLDKFLPTSRCTAEDQALAYQAAARRGIRITEYIRRAVAKMAKEDMRRATRKAT